MDSNDNVIDNNQQEYKENIILIPIINLNFPLKEKEVNINDDSNVNDDNKKKKKK